MSDRKLTNDAVKIHDRAMNTLGLERALIMLDVAKDLRSGAIEHDLYNQRAYGVAFTNDSISDCDTPCCIWGHVCFRMGVNRWADRRDSARELMHKDVALTSLFAPRIDVTPVMAANAIENYIIKGHVLPWHAQKG
jgi:hypothetical protein